MSAIHLPATHIAALVAAGHVYAKHGATAGVDMRDASDLLRQADCLATENARSLDARYTRDPACAVVHVPIELIASYATPAKLLSPLAFLKALASYDYQTCETDDYRETPAYKLVEEYRRSAIRNLPGYQDLSAWVIT